MKKFVKVAACTAVAAMMACPAFAHGAGHMNNHHGQNNVIRPAEQAVNADCVPMRRLECPMFTDEQKSQPCVNRDESVAKLETLVQAYKDAQTDEEKEEAFKNICGACHMGTGRGGGVGIGRIDFSNMTDEQKAAFEEKRAKCGELREKLLAAQTDEERAALMAEIKGLAEECVGVRPCRYSEEVKTGAAIFDLAQADYADDVEMDIEFIPATDEN